VPAINEYARALKSIAQEPTLYGGTPDDTAKTHGAKDFEGSYLAGNVPRYMRRYTF